MDKNTIYISGNVPSSKNSKNDRLWYNDYMWKPISGYENSYSINEYGKVKSIPRKTGNQFSGGCILKQHKLRSGYKYVTLKKNGKGKNKAIHRLLANHFLMNSYFEGAEVNHKDEDKTNNLLENLEWVTKRYNLQYGTARHKSSVKQRKSVIQKSLDGEFIKQWESIQEAGRNGYSAGCIVNCLKGRYKFHKNSKWEYAMM